VSASVEVVGRRWLPHEWCEETRIVVRSPRLPEAFDALSAIQVTDTHFAGSGRFAEPLIEYVAAQRPDLWLLTGDLFESVEGLPHVERLLAAMHPGLGLFFVPGNNDNRAFRKRPQTLPTLRAAGLVPLANSGVMLYREGLGIGLLGVDDPSRRRDNLDAAVAGADANAFRILLAHCVDVLPKAANAGIDFVPCGHSHGGQICLPGIGPLVSGARIGGPRFAQGVHRDGATFAYVCRGIGTSRVPLRIRCPREVVRYEFRSAREEARLVGANP